MFYLKHNWELSDKPNNHYLSDLVGHLYLCTLFDFKNKQKKTLEKIFEQVEKQIQKDGTSYEGSTSYHKLVTELLLHTYLLCKVENLEIPNNFKNKIDLMLEFLSNCHVNENFMIQIGDNDSGKIVTGINSIRLNPSIHPCFAEGFAGHSGRTANIYNKNLQIKSDHPECSAKAECIEGSNEKILNHYPHFGLTILKPKKWYITFRHPTFSNTQPTGHFHEDQLSVTLAYDDIPIIVDPGSYLYTSNAKWRNLMRSRESHNTFYKNQKTDFSKLDLFQLPRKSQKDTAEIFEDEKEIRVQNFYEECSREVFYNKIKNHFEIIDKILEFCDSNYRWNFIFHPKISLEKIDKHSWNIKFQNKKLLIFKSDIEFKKTDGFYSPNYGSMEKCEKLTSLDPSIQFSSLRFENHSG